MQSMFAATEPIADDCKSLSDTGLAVHSALPSGNVLTHALFHPLDAAFCTPQSLSPGNWRLYGGATCSMGAPPSLARRMLKPPLLQENIMPDRNETFEDGKAALRGIGDNLTSGVREVSAGVGRASRAVRDTAEAVSETVRGAATDATARMKEGVEAAQDEIEEGLEAAGDDLEHAADAGRTAWTQASGAVRDASRDALASARDTFTDVQEEVRDYVRAKPLGALAVAGAVGFAVALLLRRWR